jgi:hypothetical protein
MMLAAGGPSASTLFFGRTTSEDGAAPKVHVIMAPMETWFGMTSSCGSAARSISGATISMADAT